MSNKPITLDVFDSYASEFDGWYDRNNFVYLSEVKALRKAVPGKGKGLEIGVVTGRFASKLNISEGIDPSENMLRIAASRGLKITKASGENIPFHTDVFDHVLIAVTLSFTEKPGKVILEAKRVLKEGGKLIIGIVDSASFLGEIYKEKQKKGNRFYGQANLFSADQVIGMLKKTGLGA